MNIVVPYSEWPAELAEHLYDQGLYSSLRFRDTSGQPDGYWHLLAALWQAGESVIILESDKYPARGALGELWQCSQPWCTYPVPMQHRADPAPYPSLACTKFGSSLMASMPSLMEWVGELDVGFGVREWSRLDLAIAGLLENHDVSCHYHAAGRVEHRHPSEATEGGPDGRRA